jgi:hypothetical protein
MFIFGYLCNKIIIMTKENTITSQIIAERLIAFCRQGDWQGAYNELYAGDARSVEPYKSPIAEVETTGLQAIMEKAKRFDSLIEKIYEIKVSQPIIMKDHIAFSLTMDADLVGRGRCMILSEICVYKIQDGKIVLEQFFYN